VGIAWVRFVCSFVIDACRGYVFVNWVVLLVDDGLYSVYGFDYGSLGVWILCVVCLFVCCLWWWDGFLFVLFMVWYLLLGCWCYVVRFM